MLYDKLGKEVNICGRLQLFQQNQILQLPPERKEDRTAMITDVPTDDHFDYRQLDQELLNEAECGALSVATIFASQKMTQFHLVKELQTRLEQRYGVQSTFVKLSCSKIDENSNCKHRLIIISLDRLRCGRFLSTVDIGECFAMFCV